MQTLSSPITTEKNASQAGWTEVYDLYLKSAITTPHGSSDKLRLTPLPGGLSFFKPGIAPETDQNAAATYNYWPIKRAVVKGDAKFTDDKITIVASNVSNEWAGMLEAIDWYDVAVVVRKVSTSIASPTASDCVVLFSGQVDSVTLTNERVQLTCSNDSSALNRILPAENMHVLCRFAWADDMCTAIRFAAANYKAKTVGSGSTTILVKSTDLTEDTGSSASYGTDLINALSNAAITASSEQTAGISAASATVSTSTDRLVISESIKDGTRFTIAATSAPGGLATATNYWARDVARTGTGRYSFKVAASLGGAAIDITSAGTSVTVTTQAFQAYNVKSSNLGLWKFDTDADWGTETRGYYTIPDAQAGLANAALKPYIQFDLGSAKSPKLWRIQTPNNAIQEELPRLIVFFSSPDASTWTFESYYELPPVSGGIYDVFIPGATSARYWRICVRSRWAVKIYKGIFQYVWAYENSRNYWLGGRLRFAANTTTVALRNVSRRIIGSFSGEVQVPTLPAAPASGDTFVIERGCRGTFNDCCARKNTENFGGFVDLPYQTVIR